MFTKFDKAGAGVIGGAAGAIATHYLGIEIGAAVGTLVTAFLVYIASNQGA